MWTKGFHGYVEISHVNALEFQGRLVRDNMRGIP